MTATPKVPQERPGESYNEQETVLRRVAAVRRALNTPHKPEESIGKPKPSPDQGEGRKPRAGRPGK